MYPDIEEVAIRRRADEPHDEGVVEAVTIDVPATGQSRECYQLTSKARRLVDDNDVFPEEAAATVQSGGKAGRNQGDRVDSPARSVASRARRAVHRREELADECPDDL